MKIENILGETTNFEKKEKVEKNKLQNWLKTVSAFANGDGGKLIFGINDNDEIIGLENYKKDSEIISENIKTLMDPSPIVNVEIININDKKIIVVDVKSGNQTPYYFIGNRSRIAYIRIGNQSVIAESHNLNSLILKGTNRTFDSIETNIDFEKASFSKLKASYYHNAKKEFLNTDFESFGLVKDKKLTNAGALLADERLVYQSRIFCTRWNGLTKASGILESYDDVEIEGSIIYQYEEAVRFVRGNSRKMWKKTPDRRIEMPDYPERAVQEVIVNAIIHRDYNIMGSEVHIDIFDDRMEVYSPGGMYDGSNIKDLNMKEIASKRRNPIIADIFSRMNLMERRGSGIKKITEDYENSYKYVPEKNVIFSSKIDEFTVILKNLNYEKKEEERKKIEVRKIYKTKKQEFQIEKIMELFEEKEEITRKDVEEMLNIQKTRAKILIMKLIEINKIEKVGATRNIRYKKIEK